jgi:hypothetical protein
LASCAETRHTGTAETIAANKNRFIMDQTRVPHPRRKPISTTDSGMCRFIWNVTARTFTDRRAVLEGSASLTPAIPPRPAASAAEESVRPTIPSCDANNRAVVGPRRGAQGHPSTYKLQYESSMCRYCGEHWTRSDLLSRLGVVVPQTASRRKPHCRNLGMPSSRGHGCFIPESGH